MSSSINRTLSIDAFHIIPVFVRHHPRNTFTRYKDRKPRAIWKQISLDCCQTRSLHRNKIEEKSRQFEVRPLFSALFFLFSLSSNRSRDDWSEVICMLFKFLCVKINSQDRENRERKRYLCVHNSIFERKQQCTQKDKTICLLY